MLLIHTPRLSNRLGYTLNVIFRDVLHTEFSITTDEDAFLRHNDAKISYGPKRIGDGIYLKNSDLLFQTSIDNQEPRPFQQEGQWMLFPVYGRGTDLPFDPFAATFYMVSRYEEYLPHHEDIHGRFLTNEHLAVSEGFAMEPVVEQWALMLKNLIAERYPNTTFPSRHYQFVQTIDVDAAWCYLHKGLFRTTMGILRDLLLRRSPGEVKQRIRVLMHKEQDPYDTFDYIIEKHHNSANAHLLFFVLLAEYDQYDKPSSYHNPHTRQLIQHLGDHAKIGIHPGYSSIDQPGNVDTETRRLQNILHRHIVRSRYHFLRLQMPRSYRILHHAGLQHDYTMGYSDTIGFRAGITTPFHFYDLERDKETDLVVHPFCTMDTAMKKYMKISPAEGVELYRQIIEKIRKVDGTFCCIVHNQNLSDKDGWSGWRETYEQMLHLADPQSE